MPIEAGQQLLHYRLIEKIGEGGMGVVWRAKDTTLDRDVAIKILPDLFAGDPERLARFEREAKLLASLNHPNIAAVYGLHHEVGTSTRSARSVRFLAMELVEGEDLSQRLQRGRLDAEAAMDIARQVAEALEAAHGSGIIHRDLKPANIQLGEDGRVKVLDFGLAKALGAATAAGESDPSLSPTMTSAGTVAGVILGTASYMSPEQARGQELDKRTDVWSFGCVLYEMLSGKNMFTGDTISDVLASVLKTDPEWDRLSDDTPAGIRRLLRRCLERDPRQRLHDIADARLEIEDAGTEQEEPGAVAPAPSRRLSWLWIAAALLLGIVAGLAIERAGVTEDSTPASRPVVRSVIPLAEKTRLAGWASPVVALSPDGTTLAYVAHDEAGEQHLWVRRLDESEPRRVPGSLEAEGPFFSPDGEWIGFAVAVSSNRHIPSELKKHSLSSGLTQSICAVADFFGGSWTEAGDIWFVGAQPMGLQRVVGGSGEAERVVPEFLDDGEMQRKPVAWPQMLPGGTSLLLTVWEGRETGRLAIVDLESKELRRLGINATSARYVPTGHLLYTTFDAKLMAARFDAATGEVTGTPVALLEDVTLSGNGAAVLAVSRAGDLVYTTGPLLGTGFEPRRLVRIDRSGGVQPLPFEPDRFRRRAVPSPDGSRLAVATTDHNLWIYDLARGTRRKLPAGEVYDRDYPVWSSDGGSVAFSASGDASAGWDLYVQAADGTAPPKLVVAAASEKHPLGFLPKTSTLMYHEFEGIGPEGRVSTSLVDVDRPEDRRQLMGTEAGEHGARFSPDGQWLVYGSEESGRLDVYVRSFPGLDHPTPVSSGGGRRPQWSPDGRTLYYVQDGRLMSAAFTPGAPPRIGASRVVFELPPTVTRYTVAPDGEGFFAVQVVPGTGIQMRLELVSNWFEELSAVTE